MNKEKILITTANSHSGFVAAKELLESSCKVMRRPVTRRPRDGHREEGLSILFAYFVNVAV